jgi:gas vesicle protein
MSDGIKLGQLLCDADIITKRQLSKALAEQVKGRKGTIGEILVEMGFCSFDDITDALMNSSTDTEKHEEKHEEIHQEPIEIKPEVKDIAPIEPKKKEPIELSEDKVLDTKFTLSIQTMIAAGTGLASLIGMWYTLQGEIEEAKELPKIDIEKIFTDEYPSKPDGHNWPRSYEQYKNQVGGLQEDMDAVYDLLDEYEETIKELQKDIKDLERRKRDK